MLVDEGPRYVRELVEWGAQFDRDARGEIALAREAAHAVRRVLHAPTRRDARLGRTLWVKACTSSRLDVLDHAQAIQLLIEDGACVGARFVADAGASSMVGDVRARAVLLATGGAGQVFRETTNPAVATGDGVALAWQAGARVADLEFVQFHPTVLDVPGAPRFLLSEALRGEGARLVNARGRAFMARYDPAGDLAPRDRVARAIVRERRRTGAAGLPVAAPSRCRVVRARFPDRRRRRARPSDSTSARDPIPVGPAAHYIMGGVETDL